ncbi:MAG TPA: hypothetical protein VKY81_04100 [Natronosporangium sp.]|nr:hypothetical protein [Natronosporangium sp.]
MLEENQVRLTRSSGSLLMGPGTPYTILPGWDPWSRTNRSPQTQPRPYSHGALVGAEWVDAPTVLIPVSIYRSRASQSTWMAAHQELAAMFTAVGASGEMCELAFEWGGTEYAMFGRPAQVRVEAQHVAVGKSVSQCAFVAADPRVYSSAVTSVSTGLPVQAGGLTVPFTVPFTVTSTLIAGRLDLVNAGTAPSGLRLRFDGPVERPGVRLIGPDGTRSEVTFDITLLPGQWLDVDTTRRTAFLNGLPQSNQRGRAVWTAAAYPLLPGTTELRFTSPVYDEDSLVTVEYRSAWW